MTLTIIFKMFQPQNKSNLKECFKRIVHFGVSFYAQISKYRTVLSPKTRLTKVKNRKQTPVLF